MNQLPLAQLNRPLRILYNVGKVEFDKFTNENKSPNAATIYRVLMPALKMMQTGEVECRIDDGFVMQHGVLAPDKYNPNVAWADIIVFMRLISLDPTLMAPILRSMKVRGKVIVYEHDDYYFKVSRSSYNRHTFTAPQLESIRIMAATADMITSPNALLNAATLVESRRTTPVLTREIYNAVSLEEWEAAKSFRSKHDKVRILLSGAMNHYIDWLRFFPILKKVKEKFGDKIEIHLQGVDPRVIPSLKGNQNFTPHFYYDSLELMEKYNSIGTIIHHPVDMQLFSQELNTISPDIGIIITGTEIFDRCKSTLKFIDYTMSGASVICSRHEPYTNELLHGKDIWFAESDAEWEDGLSRLITMPEMRKKLQKEGETLIKAKYHIDATMPFWLEAFKAAYASVHGTAISLH